MTITFIHNAKLAGEAAKRRKEKKAQHKEDAAKMDALIDASEISDATDKSTPLGQRQTNHHISRDSEEQTEEAEAVLVEAEAAALEEEAIVFASLDTSPAALTESKTDHTNDNKKKSTTIVTTASTATSNASFSSRAASRVLFSPQQQRLITQHNCEIEVSSRRITTEQSMKKRGEIETELKEIQIRLERKKKSEGNEHTHVHRIEVDSEEISLSELEPGISYEGCIVSGYIAHDLIAYSIGVVLLISDSPVTREDGSAPHIARLIILDLPEVEKARSLTVKNTMARWKLPYHARLWIMNPVVKIMSDGVLTLIADDHHDIIVVPR